MEDGGLPLAERMSALGSGWTSSYAGTSVVCYRATLTGWPVAAERTIASKAATPCKISSAVIG